MSCFAISQGLGAFDIFLVFSFKLQGKGFSHVLSRISTRVFRSLIRTYEFKAILVVLM